MATLSKLCLQPAGTTGTGLAIKVAASSSAGTANVICIHGFVNRITA